MEVFQWKVRLNFKYIMNLALTNNKDAKSAIHKIPEEDTKIQRKTDDQLEHYRFGDLSVSRIDNKFKKL